MIVELVEECDDEDGLMDKMLPKRNQEFGMEREVSTGMSLKVISRSRNEFQEFRSWQRKYFSCWLLSLKTRLPASFGNGVIWKFLSLIGDENFKTVMTLMKLGCFINNFDHCWC